MTKTNRPKEFDDRLLAYLPAIKKMVNRYDFTYEEKEDLISETFTSCLEGWEKYREDGGFYRWIWWMVRYNVKLATDRKKRDSRIGEVDLVGHLECNQEHFCNIISLENVLSERELDILIKRAIGYGIVELSSFFSIGKSQISVIEHSARKKLIEMDW